MADEHFPQPGPRYWDWRCLVCSEPVTNHRLRIWAFWRKAWWRRG